MATMLSGSYFSRMSSFVIRFCTDEMAHNSDTDAGYTLFPPWVPAELLKYLLSSYTDITDISRLDLGC
jgi:hypothetical protein